MARIVIAPTADAELNSLIASRQLPKNTKQRVRRAVRGLGRFPRMGAFLSGRWEGHRYIFGPWRWLLIIYRHDEEMDRVVVVTIEDARTLAAATSLR